MKVVLVAPPDGGTVGSLAFHRCLPPAQSVVFDRGSLASGGPLGQLRVAPETLVSFGSLASPSPMAAAAGLVNGTTIRREPWPRRLAAYGLETKMPIAVDGVFLAPPGEQPPGQSSTWSGPSIMRWSNVTEWPERRGGSFEPEGVFPVRIMSDGHWAEILSIETADDDYVMRCRLAAHAHWVRVVSAALLPPDHEADGFAARRFGVAVVEISLATGNISLDSPSLVSGFYPPEGEAARQWRWTNGSGLVVLENSTSERVFTVRFTNWHEMLGA